MVEGGEAWGVGIPRTHVNLGKREGTNFKTSICLLCLYRVYNIMRRMDHDVLCKCRNWNSFSNKC